jgi:phage shock protein PspC (stress-responsive transcriptional regulator)
MTSTPYVTPPTGPEQLPPSGSADRAPLQRSRTDMMLGGVSGGLAEHTGVDALLWRVAFLGLTLAGGAGIPIYLALWVLMPAAPAGPADKTNLLDEWVERLRGRLSSRGPATAG